MYKYLISFVLIFNCSLFASWLEDYQKGFFEKKENYFYALARVNVDTPNYQKIAFNNAIGDISTQIYSKVSSKQSSFKKLENDNFSIGFDNRVKVESNMPVYGAKVTNSEIENGVYFVLVSLNGYKMGTIYADECVTLSKDIDSLYKKLKKTKDIKTKERLLNLMKQKFTKFDKFSTIAALLLDSTIKKPKTPSYLIDTELTKLYKRSAKNIDELASLLISRFSHKSINGSIQVLPFSYLDRNAYSIFSSELKNHLDSNLSDKYQVTNSEYSDTKLTGTYSVNKNVLTVKGEISNNNGDILAISLVKMKLPRGYRKSHYIPKENSYKNMNNIVLSDKLNVQARVNGRNHHLLFKEAETIRIETKVSKESYIYVIANIRLKNGKQAQYLLPVNDSDGVSQYVKFVPYQNSNLWINLGEFEVSAPFGVEFLQIFASNTNPMYTLPNIATQDIDGELFDGVILDTNGNLMSASNAIKLTRGLKRKKKKKNEVELSETILRFTTIPKSQ